VRESVVPEQVAEILEVIDAAIVTWKQGTTWRKSGESEMRGPLAFCGFSCRLNGNGDVGGDLDGMDGMDLTTYMCLYNVSGYPRFQIILTIIASL
jgi:hypothetical protein